MANDVVAVVFVAHAVMGARTAAAAAVAGPATAARFAVDHSSGYRLLKKYRYPARETKFTIFGDFRDLSLQKVLNLFKQKFEFDRNLSKNLN